jgi:hypothetical protein
MHLFYIVFASISCCNVNGEATSEYDSVFECTELSENELQRNEITLEQLTSLKLKAYFELFTLQKKHPVFKHEVEKRLKSFTKAGSLSKDSFPSVVVSNIKQVGKVIKVSDSVVKLRLDYDKLSENDTGADSVHIFITTINIRLDEIQTGSNEIIFERID